MLQLAILATSFSPFVPDYTTEELYGQVHEILVFITLASTQCLHISAFSSEPLLLAYTKQAFS